MVELICEIAGSESSPTSGETATPTGEIDRQYLESTKIREVTGWRPQVDLREGLSRTLEWYGSIPR